VGDDPERLSRIVSHALRHDPAAYGLEPDEGGWVDVEALLHALRERRPWAGMDRDQLATLLTTLLATARKQRFELEGDRIRARYGHSLAGHLDLEEAVPPPSLFHGTTPRAWEVIRVEGLRPMGRQFVHLSADAPTALAVGRRRSPTPVLLRVDADAARTASVRFRRGNDAVWLADHVPAEFLTVDPG
jgi:putative RNA 2'-phosphotransferase